MLARSWSGVRRILPSAPHGEEGSPNLERVLAGLPVPVVLKQADGTVSEQKVIYPPPDPATHTHPTVEIKDTSDETRTGWLKRLRG